MMKKEYTSFKEIEQDLRRLRLERQIALEELKGQKYNVMEELKHYQWLNWVLKAGRKYGALLLLRKVFK